MGQNPQEIIMYKEGELYRLEGHESSEVKDMDTKKPILAGR